ncbi:hypothetical protein FVA81_00390 (plasmid) [Rhizobium sp. WL3]|uniref:hypothetical protein n=1 Tax=Rhizobium sp. WL3 TaxID=2603277 RepID=UPI0011C20B9E|nr:hypothetical protein [Rhizobium sp. WL3]QEE43140.1 hypothetical protein FVA81_00390 [Rhizobium sp. WL3]
MHPAQLGAGVSGGKPAPALSRGELSTTRCPFLVYACPRNHESKNVGFGRLLHVFEVLDITPEEFFDPLVNEQPSHSKAESRKDVRNKLMEETVDHLKKLDDTTLKMVHDLVIAMEPRTVGRQ